MPQDEILNVFNTSRQILAEKFLSHARVKTYLHRHTSVCEKAVIAFYEECRVPPECALIAVGGFGRREMFPFSDLDLLVILPEDHSTETDQSVSQFSTMLWELNLPVGLSVRTPSEMLQAAKTDITVSTAFLEARFLTGNESLFKKTYKKYRQSIDIQSFFESKNFEMQQRHQRYADTPYALEPNIKESPGGLRDLQFFLWCAKAAGLGTSWKELCQNSVITETEAFHLEECQRFLNELRIYLHLMQKRHEDRLIFDVQTALAKNVGYKATQGLLSSEALMKRYYLNAKKITQLNAILLAAFSDRLIHASGHTQVVQKLDDTFIIVDDALDIISEECFQHNPQAVLKTFYLFARYRELKRMSANLLRAMWHAHYRINDRFRSSKKNKALFLECIQMHYGTYHSLKNMNTWGILGRFIPAFQHVVGMMQHDLFHAYTVDQHTMRVVKFLRRFSHSSYAHEYPLCSQIISDFSKPWLLTLAGLFHDIGKGQGGDHSTLGAAEVVKFARDFQLSEHDTALLEFLVRHHLRMSHVAQKTDISDPDVIHEFADFIKTKERLDALFLLTVADIRATSPKVWNAWKQQLLETLYSQTLYALNQGNAPAPSTDSLIAKRQLEAREKAIQKGADPKKVQRFWKELNIVYFMRHSVDEIVWHTTELASDPHNTDPVVCIRRHDAGLLFLVYTPDQKDLFARVVAFFERYGLSILDARIHTTVSGWALDTFLVEDKYADTEQPDTTDARLEKLKTILTGSIREHRPLPQARTGKLSRRSRIFPIPTRISIEKSEAHKELLLQITCTDRLGLLFAIAEVLAKYSIFLSTARISTLGERVEDTFLVQGEILNDEAGTVAFEKDLTAAINNAR